MLTSVVKSCFQSTFAVSITISRSPNFSLTFSDEATMFVATFTAIGRSFSNDSVANNVSTNLFVKSLQLS